MIPESDLEIGQFRLLDVDNKMIVPVDTHIRLIVTANDVLHSFAVPSLGLKLDCTPGRLNQASILVDRTGTFYGQCSEICLRLGRDIDYGNDILLLLFPTSCLTVLYDVATLELSSIMCKFWLSHVIKKIRARLLIWEQKNLIKILNVKFKLFEGPLPSYWHNGGLSKNPTQFECKGLQVLNIFEQWNIFGSSLKFIICRVTGIKSTFIKSVNISKLGNPGYLFSKIKWCLGYVILRLTYSPKERLETGNCLFSTWRGQDGHQANKIRPRILQNWPAYNISYNTKRIKLLKLSSNLFNGTHCYSTNVINTVKDLTTSYPSINKKLTSHILKQFKKGEWLSPDLKHKLNLFIEKSQYFLAESSIKTGMYSSETRKLFELYIHSLLFQVHAIETLSKNSGNKTSGVDKKILNNTFISKYELLKNLKKFRTNKIQPLKRIYVPKNNNEKKPLSISISISIPSILDRATQALVLSILDPIIETHSDLYSFGFRKGRSNIMALSILQKNLQSKPVIETRTVDTQYIWDAEIRKCFDRINHDWLLKNVPIPPKYLFLLDGWLKAGYIEDTKSEVFYTIEGIPLQKGGGIISPLLMNFTLNGMESILEEAKCEFAKNTKGAGAYLRTREIDGIRLSIKSVSRISKEKLFKERAIACKMVRFADDFVVISGSEKLLNMIKVKIKEFLQIRGLEIHPDKSRVIKYGINTPFSFLGYTFHFLPRTNHIRNKFLHHRKHEWRLKGRARLFIYPSPNKFKSFKNELIDLFRNSLNLSAYELISLLNPKVTGWVNYFSFSNSSGTLKSLKKFLYDRIRTWMVRKHDKSSIIWLNKQYMLLDSLQAQHGLDFETNKELQLKILNSESARTNKWNFYGLAFKDENKNVYKIPKLNILKWPTNIKNIIVVSVLAPSRELLKTNIYNNRSKWIAESLKLAALHFNKNYTLFDSLWKRDHGTCLFCKNNFTIDEDLSKIIVHHKIGWALSKNNKKDNLALCHESCHIDWHNSLEGKVTGYPISKTGLKFSQNIKQLKLTNIKKISKGKKTTVR